MQTVDMFSNLVCWCGFFRRKCYQLSSLRYLYCFPPYVSCFNSKRAVKCGRTTYVYVTLHRTICTSSALKATSGCKSTLLKKITIKGKYYKLVVSVRTKYTETFILFSNALNSLIFKPTTMLMYMLSTPLYSLLELSWEQINVCP